MQHRAAVHLPYSCSINEERTRQGSARTLAPSTNFNSAGKPLERRIRMEVALRTFDEDGALRPGPTDERGSMLLAVRVPQDHVKPRTEHCGGQRSRRGAIGAALLQPVPAGGPIRAQRFALGKCRRQAGAVPWRAVGPVALRTLNPKGYSRPRALAPGPWHRGPGAVIGELHGGAGTATATGPSGSHDGREKGRGEQGQGRDGGRGKSNGRARTKANLWQGALASELCPLTLKHELGCLRSGNARQICAGSAAERPCFTRNSACQEQGHRRLRTATGLATGATDGSGTAGRTKATAASGQRAVRQERRATASGRRSRSLRFLPPRTHPNLQSV